MQTQRVQAASRTYFVVSMIIGDAETLLLGQITNNYVYGSSSECCSAQ